LDKEKQINFQVKLYIQEPMSSNPM